MVNVQNLIQKYQTWYKGVNVTMNDGILLFEDTKTGAWYHVHNSSPIIKEIGRIYSEIGILRRCCGL